MKKLTLLLLMMSALMVSCSTEGESMYPSNSVEVLFDLDVESSANTRAISDGTGATQLMYGVFDDNGEVVMSKVVEENVTEFAAAQKHKVSLPLVKGKTYNVVFWAQNPDCEAYTVSDDMKLTIDYQGINNDEARDAFLATTGNFTVEGDFTMGVVLKRPFAQVNVGAHPFDFEQAESLGVDIALSSAAVKGVANQLDMLTGEVSGSVDVEYSLGAIPAEELLTDLDKDGNNESYTYLSMSYLLAETTATTHQMSFVFTEADGSSPVNLLDGLNNIPIQRNYRTNIIGQILTGDISFTIDIDPIYNGDIFNTGGLYYNFTMPVTIENKNFAFNTDEDAIFTSENNTLIEVKNVTFSGSVQYIAFGEYRNKGDYVAFTNTFDNVVAQDMLVTHTRGIENVPTIDYMAPLIFLRGENTLNNCTFTGATANIPDKKDYNGKYHKVIAYDCGVPNKCSAVFNGCTVDKLYAWSHSQITLNNTRMKYIRCSTHKWSKSDSHLTIGPGSVVDSIVVTSSGVQHFETIDGVKTLTATPWSPSLIIKAGAEVKVLDMNGRPSTHMVNNEEVLSVIIEDGATIGQIINNVDEIPNAPTL